MPKIEWDSLFDITPMKAMLFGGLVSMIFLYLIGYSGSLIFAGFLVLAWAVGTWLLATWLTKRVSGVVRGPIARRDFSLAQSYVTRGMFQEAIEEYREAFEEEPRDYGPWFEIGTIYYQHLQDVPKAVEAFTMASADPSGRLTPTALDQMGNIYVDQKDYDQARKVYGRLSFECEDHPLAERAKRILHSLPQTKS